ncbi:hypothetical protein [Streptomyces atroolivaceus]|uniref:hypothetical protein n=1 Tax=Streptomyces atroolivaceus TaxID=66869 RepID=UPI0037A5C2DC
MLKRITARFSALVLLLGGLLFAGPGVTGASALPGDLTCPALQTVTYNPGLTLLPQPVSFNSNLVLGPCVSLTHPSITGGTGSFQGTGPLSCVGGSPGAYNIVYNWNDGSNSTVRYTLTLDLKPGGQTVLTTIGTVISGVFAGDTASHTTLAITTDLLGCLSPGGITSVSGPIVVTFL